MKRTFLAFTSLLTLSSLAAFGADEPKADADNTDKNERDLSGHTLTSGDQSNRPEDIQITKAIRQALVKDDALSTTAKNIKIITAEGKVTLRGPVKNAEEKAKITQLAKSAAGKARVDDQLEVKASE